MSTYLNENILMNIERELTQYVNDYESMNQRVQIIEEQERKTLHELEKSYEILDGFGAIL